MKKYHKFKKYTDKKMYCYRQYKIDEKKRFREHLIVQYFYCVINQEIYMNF